MELVKKVVTKLLRDYGDHSIEDKLLVQAQEILELKRQLKNMRNEKIHVVFVCHRAQLWNSLKTVFEACMEDEGFRVTIVAIPNKKQLPGLGLNHEQYASEGAEEFFRDYPCTVIEGYDYNRNAWLDLEALRPDYLFFQNPYDICRPPRYRSDVVSLYTKICYVHYGMPFMGDFIAEESFPVAFLKHTYFHFAEFEEMRKYYVNRVPENPIHRHGRVILTGYPKLDGVELYQGCESESWHFKGEDRKYRIMWTPRWSMGEGNCTFFDFKDKLLDFVQVNERVEFLFRPHPQAFAEFLEKKQMTEQEITSYRERYERMPNAFIDTQGEYLPSFYASDVLITDESSIIPEYFLTGKPIIFTYKTTHLNAFAQQISKGFYWVKTWAELSDCLSMLMRGEDPLGEVRQQLVKEAFYLPERGAGYEIKEILKHDFGYQSRTEGVHPV